MLIINLILIQAKFQQARMSKEDSKFNETDVYRVRRNVRLNETLFLCKVIMKKHGSVQIEGMGECISLVAKISQILNKDGFGVTQSIRSLNVPGERKNISPKLSIKIEKSTQFDKMTENIVPRE